jgi:hypothetical protein
MHPKRVVVWGAWPALENWSPFKLLPAYAFAVHVKGPLVHVPAARAAGVAVTFSFTTWFVFTESMFCTLIWEATTLTVATGLGLVEAGGGRIWAVTVDPDARANGMSTEKELTVELPGVVLLMLIVKSVGVPATAELGVTPSWNFLVAP